MLFRIGYCFVCELLGNIESQGREFTTAPKSFPNHEQIRPKREMSHLTPTNILSKSISANSERNNQTGVVDLLKGVVMIVLSLGYLCDYFRPWTSQHQSFNPDQADLNVFIKWTTYYATPVFVFLTGISAFLDSESKSPLALSRHLLKRGLLLVCAELLVSTIGNGFNPSYPVFHLQGIWATGISMIALSAMVYMGKSVILSTGILAIVVPVILQTLYIGEHAWLVSPLSPSEFVLGPISFALNFPVLPAMGMIAIGYYVGNFYKSGYHAEMRKAALLFLGVGAIAIFFALRVSDPSEEATQWSKQANAAIGILLFLDVTNHSSYILYSLVTMGPTLIFLSAFEKPLNRISRPFAGFGRLSLYYFVIHIYVVHLFAESGKLMSGYILPEMISRNNLNSVPVPKPQAFDFSNVYFLLIGLAILYYSCRKWIDRCQRNLNCTQQYLR